MTTLVVAELVVDEARRVVRLDDAIVRLQRTPFDLVALLATDPERVFSYSDLLRAIWNFQSTNGVTTRRVKEAALRAHLALGRRFVFVERGVGYRLIEVA